MVCGENESEGAVLLRDVTAGNSCFGRAAQEIREKGEGLGIFNMPSPRFTVTGAESVRRPRELVLILDDHTGSVEYTGVRHCRAGRK